MPRRCLARVSLVLTMAAALLTASPEMTMLASMNYPGGKNAAGVWQTIINQMPPHDVYVEPFLGSGAILRMKLPAPLANIGVDSDREAAEACRAEWGDASGVTVIHGDGIRFLQERRWSTRHLVYADPPYLLSARRSQRAVYRHEMTERQHVELLGTLKAIPAMVILSGYESPLYREMLERWRLVTFIAMTRGGRPATECLWMNFPEPAALHDYRFIGDGFRERERIKRRIHRWTAKLQKMESQERLALAGALAGFAECGSVITRPGVIVRPGDMRSLSVGAGDAGSIAGPLGETVEGAG